MPPMDLSVKTDAELNQWIANHERRPGGTAAPLYRWLLEERVRRTQMKSDLKPERSLEHLRQAATRQVCTTYGDMAKASDLEWTRARRQMSGTNGHLDRLLDLCHARDLPLLTAICVNRSGICTGDLEEAALAGFVAGARRLGILVTDAPAFHRSCRDECWRWGREQAGKAAP